MRSYRNINCSELVERGVEPDWNPPRPEDMTLPMKALWVNRYRDKADRGVEDRRLIREVTIKSIREGIIETDFGTYALSTGRSIAFTNGIVRNSCQGRLYLLSKE